MPIKVLLIGANGFIGSSIKKVLNTEEFSVYPTSRGNNKLKNGFKKFNILDDQTWEFVHTEVNPTVVVCTAWETEHEVYWQKQSNFEFFKAIEKFSAFCFKNGVEKFIGVGSMSEYGFSPGKCNAKITPLNPQDPYSEAKVLTSLALKKNAQEFGKKANWLRIFQAYGPNENSKRLIPSLISSMRMYKSIDINFPEHRLDFIHTQDIAYAFSEVIKKDFNFEINLGTSVATSVRELCIILADLLNYPLNKINFKIPKSQSRRLIYVDPESNLFFNDQLAYTNLTHGLVKLFPYF